MYSRESTVLLVMVLSVWSVRLECRSLVYPNILFCNVYVYVYVYVYVWVFW